MKATTSKLVLVAYASKYGSTKEIAEKIGHVLGQRGLEVAVHDFAEIKSFRPYSAVIIGSAVYAGRWLKMAQDFVKQHAHELKTKPTWLFSSGPVGYDKLRLEEKSVQLGKEISAIPLREHKIFAGKLDRQKLKFYEQAMVFAFRAHDGDYRDWNDIEAWSLHIAEDLNHQRSKK